MSQTDNTAPAKDKKTILQKMGKRASTVGKFFTRKKGEEGLAIAPLSTINGNSDGSNTASDEVVLDVNDDELNRLRIAAKEAAAAVDKSTKDYKLSLNNFQIALSNFAVALSQEMTIKELDDNAEPSTFETYHNSLTDFHKFLKDDYDSQKPEEKGSTPISRESSSDNLMPPRSDGGSIKRSKRASKRSSRRRSKRSSKRRSKRRKGRKTRRHR